MKINLILIATSLFMSSTAFSQLKAPIAKKEPKILENLNHQRVDNYFWMNQRDSKEVLDYIALENEYSESYFKPLQGLQDILLDEFENRIDPNAISAPFNINNRTYQVRQKEGKDYPYVYLIDGKKETIFLDENERATGHNFYQMGDWSTSPDNSLLAIGEDYTGRRKYNITFRKDNGKFLSDKIENAEPTVIWANDNKTIFYCKKDEKTLRPFQVWKHVLGKKTDELVFEELDEKYYVSLDKSLNREYIKIVCHASLTSEILLIKADQPNSKPVCFLKREEGHIYEVEPHTKGFYILSNLNAENNQLLFAKELPQSVKDCQIIQKHDKKVLIENIAVFESFIVLEERSNGLEKLKLVFLNDQSEKYIQVNEETYSLSLHANDDFTGKSLRYAYNSMTTPPSVYEYNVLTEEKTLIHRNELIEKSFSPDNYSSERIWATAYDGTLIPVSLVYKKGTDLKKAPMLLYGYGSYGYTIPSGFSATRLSLLDRGFVFAVAHIRGGKYMGEEWYQNGKFDKKRNTFTDFINCAEYLGMKGYCDPAKIYAQGGSAGGLLMGAITNMAPYLFKGIVSQVSFVDVVTTMLDETIPLTVGEYDEWGNPNEEKYYYYMLSYSPYDNIKPTHYPAILMTTGYHDSQVQYWEPLKYIAKMRELKQDNNPLLFDCNMDAGHGGGSGRSTVRKEIAQVYAFILDLEGQSK
jgi:oligopeptidase B